MSNIVFNTDYDVRIVPYSPVSQYDNVDIRLQVFNKGDKGEDVRIKIYLDEDNKNCELYTDSIKVEPNCYGFVKVPVKFLGKVGEHKLLFSVNGDKQTMPLTVLEKYPNIVDGGFIVLNGTVDGDGSGDSGLSEDDWATVMDDYDKLGFKTIIIQCCAKIKNAEKKEYVALYSGSSIFKTEETLRAKNGLKKILQTAEKNGQHVFLGLLFGKLDLSIQRAFVKDLYDNFSKYKSLYGWYSTWEYSMCREVNEYDYDGSVCAEEIVNMRKIVDEISPCMPILYSPYLTSNMNYGHRCGTSASLLEAIANGEIKIDILAPHDHCGQIHKLSNQRMVSIDDAVRMFATLKQACDKGGVHLWANCEDFNLNFIRNEESKSGYYKYDFGLIPKHIGGELDGEGNLISHANSLRNYNERIITFMIYRIFKNPESNVKLGNKKSEEFFNRYLEYVKHPAPSYKNIARGMSYTLKCNKEIYEPDCAYTFYDQFKYGGRDIFHKDYEKGGLLTDGLMFGATPDDSDVYLTLGTALEEYGEQCQIEVVIDLMKDQKFEKVRWFSAKNEKFNADKVVIEYSHDNKNFFYFGEDNGKYINGWDTVSTDRDVSARYIKLTFIKTNKENWKTWLTLDEIEVLAKV